MSAGDARGLELTVEGGVARLTLVRPEAHNALDLDLVRALDEETERLDRLVRADEVRCLVVQAEGRDFCVGGDLHAFTGAADTTAHIRRMATYAHRGIDRLHHLPVPVFSAVRGAVAGAGLGLVLASDVVVASTTTTFTLAYAAAGITPDAGVSWGLPRAIGHPRAMDALLSNRRVGAAEAAAWGLVSRVVDDSELEGSIADLVRSVAVLPAEVLRESKRLMRRASDVSVTEHLDDEAETIARLAATPYAQQAIASFLRPRGSVPAAR